MNQPGSFVHWSIFDVWVANLALIAVMVVIFGAALLLPLPRRPSAQFRVRSWSGPRRFGRAPGRSGRGRGHEDLTQAMASPSRSQAGSWRSVTGRMDAVQDRGSAGPSAGACRS
jgi:hypothetical protein